MANVKLRHLNGSLCRYKRENGERNRGDRQTETEGGRDRQIGRQTDG